MCMSARVTITAAEACTYHAMWKKVSGIYEAEFLISPIPPPAPRSFLAINHKLCDIFH